MRRSDALASLFLVLVGCDPATPAARPTPRVEPPAPVAPREAPLEYVERVTGGAATSARLPTIIAIHGLGDRPETFVTLFENLPVAARVIAPRAPNAWGDGFAWMTTRVRDGQEAQLDAEIATCTRRLASLVESIAARPDVTGEVVVTGFSQGGILTYAVTVARPELFRGAFPIAGLLPTARLETLPAAPADAPAIVAFHGDADVVVPYARDVALVEALRARGWPITLETSPGTRHTIPDATREALEVAIVRAITPND